MNSSETIVCKPTPWFLLRAAVALVMFGVFSVLFYIDGSTGYRKKNESFYLQKAFQSASAEFAAMNAKGGLTADGWKRHAERQTVALPEDRSLLPAGLKQPMPWPVVLHDYDRMKSLQPNILWLEYSREKKLSSKVEHAFDAGKIREQWIVFGICAGLAALAAFFLLRTLRRSISVDAEAITSQQGRRIPYKDLKTLDLRKWQTKGLALISYDGAAGRGTIRVDGLTYGGFNKENDEPAERLMRQIRARFSGEILEYATISEAAPDGGESKPA